LFVRLRIAELRQQHFPTAWRSRCLAALREADAIYVNELYWWLIRFDVRKAILLGSGGKAGKLAKNDLGAKNYVFHTIASLSKRRISSPHGRQDPISAFEIERYERIASIALSHLHETEGVAGTQQSAAETSLYSREP
jgi:hypothetical protein